MEESGTWAQYVSKEPASRLDVIALQEQLDKKLSERKARETGICPVREELYGQCMDELIRQITIDGPERGLLMLRTRDEIRMTIDAYKTLFANSVTFGESPKPACLSPVSAFAFLKLNISKIVAS